MPTPSGLSRAPHAGALASDDCRAISDNSRDANLRSKKLDFIRLWGLFPFTGDFPLFGGAVTAVLSCDGMSPKLRLVTGLAIALSELGKHATEAVKLNVQSVSSDRVFLFLFLSSCAGFAKIASEEAGELSKECVLIRMLTHLFKALTSDFLDSRRAAAKLEAQRIASAKASQAALELPAAGLQLAVQPTVAAVEGKKKPKPSAFWEELKYILKIAFPKGLASRGGMLLTTQFGVRFGIQFVARVLSSPGFKCVLASFSLCARSSPSRQRRRPRSF